MLIVVYALPLLVIFRRQNMLQFELDFLVFSLKKVSESEQGNFLIF